MTATRGATTYRTVDGIGWRLTATVLRGDGEGVRSYRVVRTDHGAWPMSGWVTLHRSRWLAYAPDHRRVTAGAGHRTIADALRDLAEDAGRLGRQSVYAGR